MFLVERFGCQFGGIVAQRARGRIPGKNVFFGDDNLWLPVAIEVEQAGVGVAQVEVGDLCKGLEGFPVVFIRQLKIAVQAAAIDHYLFTAIRCEVLYLQNAIGKSEERWLGDDRFPNGKMPISQVLLIKPAIALLGEDSSNAFIVEINPLVAGTEAYRGIGCIFRGDIADFPAPG